MTVFATENNEWLVLDSILGLDWASDAAIETGLQPAHFADEVAAKLYEVIHRRRGKGLPVNVSDFTPEEFAGLTNSQTERLERKLTEAQFEIRTGVSAAMYSHRVIESGLQRLHGESIRRMTEDTRNGMEWPEAEARHQRRVTQLLDSTASEFKTFRESSAGLLSELENPKTDATGIRSGFHDLDSILGGLRPGALIVPTAPTGGGKTALSICIANSVAKTGGLVGFISAEMKLRELHQRIACIESSVDSMKLKRNRLDDDEKRRYSDAVKSAAKLPFLVVDDNRNLDTLAPRLRSKHRKTPFALVVADYTQLLKSTTERNASREQKVAEVALILKDMAMELNCPVIAPAQHNKEADRREGKPSPTDLRESAALGHTADVVLFISPPDSGGEGEASLFVAKNRGGPEGRKVILNWRPQFTRFENHAFDEPYFTD